MIKASYLENILKGALATGNWGMKVNANKQGVSQVLNRLTHISTISHLRRIQTPSDNTGKLSEDFQVTPNNDYFQNFFHCLKSSDYNYIICLE